MMEAVDDFIEEDLDVAAFQDNSIFILRWLDGLNDAELEACRDLRGKVLRKASYFHSVDTVKAVLSTGKFTDVIDECNSHGETPLHLAAKGRNLNTVSGKKPTTTNNLLEVVYWLYKHGANPTLNSEEEETPKITAIKQNFKIGAAFLEILENIWSGRCTQSRMGYNDIKCLHKEILQWAVCTLVDDDVVRCILVMYSAFVRTQSTNIMQYLLGGTEGLNGHTLIHSAASASQMLLETILTYSRLPLNVIANVQEEYIYGQGTTRFVETPLSLSLWDKSLDECIDAFVRRQSDDNHLTHIDLSYTKISHFPSKLFALQYLCTLNISHNSLLDLPFSNLSLDSCSLYEVNLSYNSLTRLPIELFDLPFLKKLDVSYNPIDSLPDKWWLSKNLKSLNLSHTELGRLFQSDHRSSSQSTKSRSTSFLKGSTHKVRSRSKILSECEDFITLLDQNLDGSPLNYLNISYASLDDFPNCLACYFPNLTCLDISNNNISSCCTIDELPALLEGLDISHNKLQSEDSAIFSLIPYKDNYRCYVNTSYDDALRCKHMRHNTLAQLKKLNLSHNAGLENVVMHHDNLHSGTALVNLFFPNLNNLLLNNCNLLQLPEHLSKMADIHTLHIGHNKELRIEKKICSMERLLNFNCDGLTDPLVSELNKFTTVKEKLMFLRQIRYDGVPAVKVFLMGLGSCGKTTLLHHLRDVNDHSLLKPTVGISQEIWLYPKVSIPKMCFYVRDFSGKYSPVHQCYICRKSLYVLCWRVCDGLTAVKDLKEYLLAIKARARYSAVVMVGTHIDLVDNFDKKKDHLVEIIQGIYSCEFYPSIRAIKFVSCKGKCNDSVEELIHCLYETAGRIKSYLGDKLYTQRLSSMTIPASYYRLQEKILNKMNDKSLPVVVWKDIVSLGEQYDLQKAEILVAVTYIKEHGKLMDLGSVDNQTFCFVDSQWLFDVLTLILTLQFDYTATGDGKVSKVKLEEFLTRKLKLAPFLIDPIILLLQKCGLIVPLSSHTLLMPSLLQNIYPEKLFATEQGNFPQRRSKKLYFVDHCVTPARGIHLYSSTAQQTTINYILLHFTGVCYRRIFLVHYLPVSFWPKLLSRLLSSGNFNSFHKIICDNCIPQISYKHIATNDTALIGELLCRWSCYGNCIELSLGEHIIFRINAFCTANNKNNDKIPISATMSKIDDGMLIYTPHNTDRLADLKCKEGFEISVPDYEMISRTQQGSKVHYSDVMSVQILSHILEIVDEVLMDWFEGQLDKGIYSNNDDVFQLIPCPYCYDDKCVIDSRTIEFSTYGNSYECLNNCVAFTVQAVLVQVQKSDTINCLHHDSLLIKHLAPDLVFDDILVDKIDTSQLQNENKTLGKGGFGKVEKMKYLKRGIAVAVKSCTRTSPDGMEDDIPQVYSLVRQELNKILSIDHTNIIKCIGFCISTLSFVMECAPFGNVKNLLKAYSSTGYYLCPESLVETAKQVSSALVYLHSKAIVHYDIKPDNILVFSFPQAGHDCFTAKDTSLRCTACQNGGALVKLADLGVSAFVGPEGFYRKPSTPGHTAPEVMEYHGLEPLGEKVDIFSLGMTIYELMTLQVLPPLSIKSQEFDWNIRNGLRPSILTEEENPNYPIILKELVVNCWAQEYAARPTAQEIVSILQSPDCLKLTNTYNTELPYSVVSAALVVTVEDQQSLWLAHTTNDGDCEVSVYEFAKPESCSHVNLFEGTPIQIETLVVSMCQLGMHVWMASQHGTITVVSATTLSIVHQTEEFKFDDEDLIEMITIDSQARLLALTYKSGVIAFVDLRLTFTLHNDLSNFKANIVSTISTSGPQMCTAEVCNSANNDLWCGCDLSTIKVITTPQGNSQPYVKATFSAHASSADIPQDSSIMQLKSCPHSTSNIVYMYALHNCGSVVSCWSVGDQPTLVTVIKLDHLHSPASIILPLGATLYVTDTIGSVYSFNLNEAISDSANYHCSLLLCHHQSALLNNLFVLHGRMNTKGFLTNIGSVSKLTDDNSLRPHVCCDVLLGMGAGYQDLFKYNNDISDQNLYFIIWVLPKT
ncbi:leucine-rich repeat serine/threonine-protein kinase 1-like isoform X1 [Dysidea avara]|uniref:leucine-rich repeat serine/threonine-protein kinase 1-like isoform X1 n=2 Tax=Dysidea avara TaxID=196820 RepID=UPI00332C690C